MKASKLRVFNNCWLNWQVHLHYIQMPIYTRLYHCCNVFA